MAARELSRHPVDVGTRSEAAILAAFVEQGFDVLLPWGTNHRYDRVLDLGSRFVRVQRKTGRLRQGAIEFRSQSVRSNTSSARVRTYVGEVEYFAVCCAATGGVYVVPCDETTRGHTTLRLEPTANRQNQRVRWAAEHHIERFAP